MGDRESDSFDLQTSFKLCEDLPSHHQPSFRPTSVIVPPPQPPSRSPSTSLMQSPAVLNSNAQQAPNGAPPSAGGGAMSGGPSDFIGALISLISRADIRYQGFLASIDPVQATIALEKGQSCSLLIVLTPSFSSTRLILLLSSPLSSLVGYRRSLSPSWKRS